MTFVSRVKAALTPEAIAERLIKFAHRVLRNHQEKLEAESIALYNAATAAFKLAGEKSAKSLQVKFKAEDIDRLS
jgi:hypothetical protein